MQRFLMGNDLAAEVRMDRPSGLGEGKAMLTRVTLDQLQVLVSVADHGSFSAAARQLNRVQSAVSQAIISLEDALDLKLFDRTRKVPQLTDAGRAIVVDARRLLSGADALKARARNIAMVAEPEISLAIEQVFPNAVLLPALSAFRERYPLVSVTIFAEGLGGPEQSLMEDNARMSIYSPARDGTPGIQMEFVGNVPVSPIAAASHPLSRIPHLISQAELDDHVQLTLTDRTKRYRGVVMGSRTWGFIDQMNRLEFALNGFGWCVMPTHLAQPYLDSGDLVELRLAVHGGQPLLFPLYAAYKVDRPLGPAACWLLTELKERFARWSATDARQDDQPGIQVRVTTA